MQCKLPCTTLLMCCKLYFRQLGFKTFNILSQFNKLQKYLTYTLDRGTSQQDRKVGHLLI